MANQLESGRARAVRSGGSLPQPKGSSPLPSSLGQNGQNAPTDPNKTAEDLAKKGLDTLGKSNDPRIKLAAKAAKMLGADKAIAKNKQVQEIAKGMEAVQSLQNLDPKAAFKLLAKRGLKSIWGSFFSQLAEPLVGVPTALYGTFLLIEAYFLGTLFMKEWFEPMSLADYVGLVLGFMAQFGLIILALVLLVSAWCMTDSSCLWEIGKKTFYENITGSRA